MNINKSIKFFGMMCICGMFTAAGTQTVLAGPADGFEAEMVAKVKQPIFPSTRKRTKAQK